MKKRLLILLIISAMAFSGCSQSNKANVPVNAQSNNMAQYTPVTMEYEIYGKTYKVVFDKKPTRAVTLSQFMTEMLLALGLENQMVGTAYMDNSIYPDFKTAYEKIPVLSDKYPSKEVLFSAEPDFVSGWASAFNEKRVASADDMIKNGIKPYLSKSIGDEGSFAALYQDFADLGKIFAVEDKAKEVISKMQEEIQSIQQQIGDITDDQMLSVLAFDSGDKEPFVVGGGGISGDIIRQAKGKNIFDSVKKGYATVSWEEVVEKNPDIIVIVDYGDTDYQSKVDFLKSNPALKDLKAIKEDRFVKIGLADLSPGIRNTKAVETLAKGFYPERFK